MVGPLSTRGALYPETPSSLLQLCKPYLASILVRLLGLCQRDRHMLRTMCRAESLPEDYVPEITEALKKVGLEWKDFKLVNNACPPHPEEGLVSNIVGGLKDINPKEEKPEESPVQVGQGPKYSYMESSDKSNQKLPTPEQGGQEGSLTNIAP